MHIPFAMFQTRRAICPGCGAPVELQEAQAKCGFCGGIVIVERRLRHIEPNVPAERRTVSDGSNCWGCGASLLLQGTEGIVKCATCGCESKIERRAVLAELDIPIEKGEDKATVQLIERLKATTDLADRVEMAHEAFDGWHHTNRTMVRRLRDFLALLPGSDPRFEYTAAEIVGKLLCEDGDALIREGTIRAAEPFLPSHAVTWQVGLGPGICLKPLLDAADAAWREGDRLRTGMALWAAQTLLGRNYPEHPGLAQIILYRLMYVSGPVLGWALRFLQGQGGIGYRYPTDVLVRFIDDCAAEKPTLVPEIEKGIYASPKSDGELRALLDLFGTLRTPEAKSALVRALPEKPAGVSLRLAKQAEDLRKSFTPVSTPADPEIAGAMKLWDECISAAVDEWNAKTKLARAYVQIIQGRTALMRAKTPAEIGDGPLDETNPHGRTALMFAAEAGRFDVVRALLARGADPTIRDQDGRTAYMISLIEEIPHAPEEVQDEYRRAVEAEDLAMVRRLLDLGADPDVLDDQQSTPLMKAAQEGKLALVRLLLSANAQFDHRDSRDRTAMMYAAEQKHVDVVRELLARGADASGVRDVTRDPEILALLPEPEPTEADLLEAVKKKDAERVRKLLERGIRPNYEIASWAMDKFKPQCLQALLEGGLDVRMEGLLHRLVVKAWPEMIEIFLQRGADVNAKDGGGSTPLQVAAMKGFVDIARIFLTRGADRAGALESAKMRAGNEEMIRLLGS